MRLLKDFKINKDLFYSLLAAVFIVVALYPFWFFGEYSSLGWYDEVDAQIPWNYLITNIDKNTTFVHQWASGVGRTIGYGSEEVSIYRIFLNMFPLWVSNVVIKFLSLFTFFLGLYFLILNLFRISRLLAFSASLFALSATYLPYGWTFGGHGFDLSIAIWISLAFLGKFSNIKINYIIGLVVVVLGSIVSGPIFLYVLAGYLFLFILISFKNKDYFSLQRLYLWIILIILSVTLSILNWQSLYDATFGAKEFSARLLGTLIISKDLGSGFYEIFSNNLKEQYKIFNIFSSRFSTIILDYAYYIIAFLLILTRQVKVIVIFIFLAILFPPFIDSLFKALEISIFSTYRWNILWYLLPIHTVLVFMYLISKIEIDKKYINILTILFSVYFIYLSFYGIYKLSNITMIGLNAKGGAGIVNHYDKLKTLQKNDERFISDYKTSQWAMPIYYNLSTFDGAQPSFSHRRSYFLAYGVSVSPKNTYHPNKHFFYFFRNSKYYNMELLEMANVRYIITSRNKILQSKNRTISIKGLKYSELKTNNPLKNIYIKYIGDVSLVNTIYVYKLENTWPKLFSASSYKVSNYSFKDKEFYEELKKLNKNKILIAKDDIEGDMISQENNLDIENYMLTKNGITVNINKGSGYLVYNQIYLPHWKAFCNKEELEITPSNGIMMLVYINKGCKKVDFIYNTK